VLASVIAQSYFWLSFVWLLFGQAVLIMRLWFVSADVPTLFGSPRLVDVYSRLESTVERNLLILPVLLACGVLLLVAVALSRRRCKPEQVSFRLTWAVGGLMSNALLWASFLVVNVVVKATYPDWDSYGPPPSTAQLGSLIGMIALGLALLVCVMRQARRYRLRTTGWPG
jgi:hypothetical protein